MKPITIFPRLVVLIATMMCALDANSQEAYACYTSSNNTLTFYYDNQRSSRDGKTFDLNTGNNSPDWYTDGTGGNVIYVIFDSSFAEVRPTTTFDWFYYMGNLQSIEGMNYLNTSEVTNMAFMFSNCKSLKNLDLSHFDTSKVSKMVSMFNSNNSLISLDLSSFNTTNVADMNNMFYRCTKLQTIYVGDGWNTAAVTSSDGMFYNCTQLVGVQGTTYKSSNPGDKTYAHLDGGTNNPGYFTAVGAEPWTSYACYTPSNSTLTFYFDNKRSSHTGTTYDVIIENNQPDWITNNYNQVTKVVFDPSFADARPTTTGYWFNHMMNLQSITGLSYLNTSEVTYMAWMFANCSNLTSLDLSSFNTAKVTNMYGMFDSCTELTSLDLSSFNTAKVAGMYSMFYGCTNLQTIYVGDGWSTAKTTESRHMFDNCTSLVGGLGTTYDVNHLNKDYARIDGGTSNPGYFTYKGSSGVTTRIENGQKDAVNGQKDEWYTLDGQKLSGKPTKRGVYIQKGRAVAHP